MTRRIQVGPVIYVVLVVLFGAGILMGVILSRADRPAHASESGDENKKSDTDDGGKDGKRVPSAIVHDPLGLLAGREIGQCSPEWCKQIEDQLAQVCKLLPSPGLFPKSGDQKMSTSELVVVKAVTSPA